MGKGGAAQNSKDDFKENEVLINGKYYDCKDLKHPGGT
jgi:hypothetical protein